MYGFATCGYAIGIEVVATGIDVVGNTEVYDEVGINGGSGPGRPNNGSVTAGGSGFVSGTGAGATGFAGFLVTFDFFLFGADFPLIMWHRAPRAPKQQQSNSAPISHCQIS
jgi:hypothetical protein